MYTWTLAGTRSGLDWPCLGRFHYLERVPDLAMYIQGACNSKHDNDCDLCVSPESFLTQVECMDDRQKRNRFCLLKYINHTANCLGSRPTLQ